MAPNSLNTTRQHSPIGYSLLTAHKLLICSWGLVRVVTCNCQEQHNHFADVNRGFSSAAFSHLLPPSSSDIYFIWCLGVLEGDSRLKKKKLTGGSLSKYSSLQLMKLQWDTDVHKSTILAWGPWANWHHLLYVLNPHFLSIFSLITKARTQF